MSKKLFIFEDDKYDRFFPLTYNRPVYELLYGITRIKEKIRHLFPGAEVVLLCRDYLERVLATRTGQKVNQFEVKKDDEILLSFQMTKPRFNMLMLVVEGTFHLFDYNE